MAYYEVILFVSVVIICKIIDIYSYWWKKGVQIIGFPIPFFGHALEHLMFNKGYHELLHKYYFKFKSKRYVGIYASHKPYLLLTDPILCKKIFVDYFDKFPERGSYSKDDSNDPLTKHIINFDKVRWKLIRDELQPVLNTTKCKQFIPLCLKSTDSLVNNIKVSISNKDPIKIDVLFRNYLTELFVTICLGITYESFVKNDLLKEIMHEIIYPNKLNSIRTFFAFTYSKILKVLNWHRLSNEKIRYLENFFVNVYDIKKKNPTSQRDLFTTLSDILSSDKVKHQLGDWEKLLMSNCLALMVAGSDTSHTSLTMIIFNLAKHQDIQEKLFLDVRRSMDQHGSNIAEAISDMKYLDAVIQEGIRMYPTFPLTMRKCKERCKLSDDGLILDPGDSVIIPIEAFHYDPEYFPDPYTFNPERFLQMTRNDYKNTYIPFGKGARNCVGYQFAKNELRLCLARLVDNFKFNIGPRTPEEVKFEKYAFGKKTTTTVYMYPELRT